MHLCRAKKVGIFLEMGFVNVAVIWTVMLLGVAALLICAPEARLQMNVVCLDQMPRPVQVYRPGRIYIMLFVECFYQMSFYLLADISGNSSNVLRQTAVWAKLACGRENAPLMGAP